MDPCPAARPPSRTGAPRVPSLARRYTPPVITLLLLAVSCAEDPVAERPWTDPTGVGPWDPGVTSFTTTGADGEQLAIEVWYPAIADAGAEPDRYLEVPMAGTAYREATPATADGPFPLIAFSHGSQGIRYQSISLTEHWASHGFVVVATDHPGNTFLDPEQLDLSIVADRRPGQVVSSVDALLERTADPGHRLHGLTQGASYAMTGHSFGAWTTLAVAGGQVDHARMLSFCESEPDYDFCRLSDSVLEVPGSPDPRATHALSMAPGGWYAFLDNGLASVAPAMVWGGTKDEMTDYLLENRPTYERLESPKELWTLQDAGHFVYSDLCRVAPFISDECFEDRGFIDLPTGQAIVRTVTTSWLRRSVAGDARDQAWWDEQQPEWDEVSVESE